MCFLYQYRHVFPKDSLANNAADSHYVDLMILYKIIAEIWEILQHLDS